MIESNSLLKGYKSFLATKIATFKKLSKRTGILRAPFWRIALGDGMWQRGAGKNRHIQYDFK
jgi:hypothetical protein